MSHALQGLADVAEPAQILQWRLPMELNVLNLVPMGQSSGLVYGFDLR